MLTRNLIVWNDVIITISVYLGLYLATTWPVVYIAVVSVIQSMSNFYYSSRPRPWSNEISLLQWFTSGATTASHLFSIFMMSKLPHAVALTNHWNQCLQLHSFLDATTNMIFAASPTLLPQQYITKDPPYFFFDITIQHQSISSGKAPLPESNRCCHIQCLCVLLYKFRLRI